MVGTRTRDEVYDLLSVLYAALEGAESCERYLQDAEAAGDEALCRFFREVQDEERAKCGRAKTLLKERMDPEAGERLEQDLSESFSAGH